MPAETQKFLAHVPDRCGAAPISGKVGGHREVRWGPPLYAGHQFPFRTRHGGETEIPSTRLPMVIPRLDLTRVPRTPPMDRPRGATPPPPLRQTRASVFHPDRKAVAGYTGYTPRALRKPLLGHPGEWVAKLLLSSPLEQEDVAEDARSARGSVRSARGSVRTNMSARSGHRSARA
jgi:hypothetical protein